MKEKVTHLTEAQLKEIIYESVITTMNEADAAAYSRAHKATNPARKDNLLNYKKLDIMKYLGIFESCILPKGDWQHIFKGKQHINICCQTGLRYA